jgi:hypothetical protein
MVPASSKVMVQESPLLIIQKLVALFLLNLYFQGITALKVGRSARDFPGPRAERDRPDRWGASSESGSSCPLRAHAASGVRHRMPARIEGGDERLALALTSEPGQPALRRLEGSKMKRMP